MRFLATFSQHYQVPNLVHHHGQWHQQQPDLPSHHERARMNYRYETRARREEFIFSEDSRTKHRTMCKYWGSHENSERD